MDESVQPNTPEQSRIPVIALGSLIVIVVLVAGIVLFARQRVSETREEIVEPGFETETVTGRIGLSQKGTQATYRTGQQVTLFVYADSQEEEITGYDAVLRYDSTKLEFVAVKSVLDGMDIYETIDPISEINRELIVTGVRSLSRQEPFVFNNTALAEVTFTVLDGGPIDVNVVYEPGSNRESNLITARNDDILSNVVGTTIEVR